MTPLITALTDPGVYDHPVNRVEVIETHISWVLLAGDYAYKVKKPVKLAFVDFSSLAARRAYCEDELRLNRRLAPQLYLEMVAITGSARHPQIGGTGPALEYAVRMRRFDQDALFNRLLERGELEPSLIDTLAGRIAEFHAGAPVTPTDSAFGTPASVLQPALDNITAMAAEAGAERRAVLDELEAWTHERFHGLEPAFAARRRDGYVRECHGDLHLGNIALIDGEPVAFDCIEFSADLRWIDVMNETGFLVMDLIDRGRADLGYRFLDVYLQASGDYAGVAVLRFYLVYRALVRAKIHDLRARQVDDDPDEANRLDAAADHYLGLARQIAHGGRPTLILMHGLSGSGKSRVAASLVERLGAVRLRSDVERKRLFDLDADARSGSAVDGGIYRQEASRLTYDRLTELAQTPLRAGYPTIIDAAFLAHWQRGRMRELAAGLDVALLIVDCTADEAILRERVGARHVRGDDPSEATATVLEHQLRTQELLAADELRAAVFCDMNGDEADDVAACITAVERRLD